MGTEEERRERQRCVDAGDESANLKFTKPAPQPRGGGYQGQRGGGSYQGRSSGGYDSRGDARSGYGDRGGHSDQHKRSYADQKSSAAYPVSKAPRSGAYETPRHGSGSYGASRGGDGRAGGSSYAGSSRHGSSSYR